jgi:hypothetical protein
MIKKGVYSGAIAFHHIEERTPEFEKPDVLANPFDLA